MLGQHQDVPIAVCGDRPRAVEALADLGCDVVIADDAFSHRRMRRHVDIVVLRKSLPLGKNGRLLPWGSLREPASSLGRATVIWLHGRASQGPARVSQGSCQGALWVESTVSEQILRRICGVRERMSSCIAVCGIARPQSFRASLGDVGVKPKDFVGFPDHARYTHKHVDALHDTARARGCDAVLTTAKDAAKLKALWPPKSPISLWVLHIRAEVVGGVEALEAVLGLPKSLLGHAFSAQPGLLGADNKPRVPLGENN